MDIKTLFLIVFMVIIIGTFIVGGIIGILLVTRQRTVVRVVSRNKRFIRRVFRGVMPETFEVDGKMYNYDNAGEVRNIWGASIYYLESNPHCLIFDHDKHVFVTDAKDLKHIYKNNLIAQLLSGDKIMTIIIFLIAITLMLVAVDTALPFIIEKTCDLTNSPANMELIKNAVKEALK